MSSAQELTEKSRNKIENFFNAKTFDKYGSREFSGIAYESGEPGKYLIVAENYIVEITRNGK